MDRQTTIGTRKRERPRNRQGEGGRLRQELMAAASRLLAQGGDPDDLSLRAVAREAGVSAPSVYLQFASKEELLRAVVTEHFATFQRAIEAGMATGSDPASRLFAGCVAYCYFAVAQPGSYRIIFESPSPAWEEQPVDARPGMSAFQVLVDGIAACQESGLAAPGDPFQIAVDVWTALHGIASLRRDAPSFPWPSLERQLARMLAALTGIDVSNFVHATG